MGKTGSSKSMQEFWQAVSNFRPKKTVKGENILKKLRGVSVTNLAITVSPDISYRDNRIENNIDEDEIWKEIYRQEKYPI